MRLTGNFEKKIKKNSELFFSTFSFLSAFVVSSCRKSGFRVFLILRYGADLGCSRLVVCFHSLLLAFLLKFLARFLAFLAFSRISWQESWRFMDFLGFLDKILGFSWKVFILKNTFSAFFQLKKLGISL